MNNWVYILGGAMVVYFLSTKKTKATQVPTSQMQTTPLNVQVDYEIFFNTIQEYHALQEVGAPVGRVGSEIFYNDDHLYTRLKQLGVNVLYLGDNKKRKPIVAGY